MSLLNNFETKQELKRILKNKISIFYEKEFKPKLVGNETFKKIMYENLLMRAYVNVYDGVERWFDEPLASMLGSTKEEQMTKISEFMDEAIQRAKST